MTPEEKQKIIDILSECWWETSDGKAMIIPEEMLAELAEEILNALPEESEYCPNSMLDVLFKSECNCCEPNALPEERLCSWCKDIPVPNGDRFCERCRIALDNCLISEEKQREIALRMIEEYVEQAGEMPTERMVGFELCIDWLKEK